MFEMISRQLLRGRCLAMLSTAVLGLGLSAVRADADQWDKKTTVTFSAPVEVPGKVLPAGTYVFKLLDSPSERHIVQIYDADQKKLFATILALPDYRLKPTDKPVLRFAEPRPCPPEAIEAFFYPDDNFGLQFVYPHERAVELAKRTNHNVLSMSDDMSKNMAAGAKSGDDPSVKAMENTQVTGVDPSGAPVELLVVIAARRENYFFAIGRCASHGRMVKGVARAYFCCFPLSERVDPCIPTSCPHRYSRSSGGSCWRPCWGQHLPCLPSPNRRLS